MQVYACSDVPHENAHLVDLKMGATFYVRTRRKLSSESYSHV